MPLEPLDEAARLGRLEGLIERGRHVRVQVVLHEHDLVGLRKMNVAQVLENAGIIDRRAPLGDLHMPKAFEWRKQHEQVGGAVALILVVVASRLAGPHGQRHSSLGDQLLGGLVEADQRPARIVRTVIDLEHILHRRVVAKHASGMTWRSTPPA